jgi:hypothetical protein
MDDSNQISSLLTWLGGATVAAVLAIVLVVAIALTPLAALAVFAFGLGGSAELPVAALNGLGNTLLPGRIWRQSEFVHGLTGDCGPDVLTMAMGWAVQQPVDGATVYATYLRMRSRGLADPNGISTLADLAREAQVDGYPYALLPYDGNMPTTTWTNFFATYVGREAIVYQTADGQALVDAVSGLGENAVNLHGHFLMLVGRHVHSGPSDPLPTGFWAADGDNFAIGNVLQLYPDTLVAASHPVGALAFPARVPMPSPAQQASGGGLHAAAIVAAALQMAAHLHGNPDVWYDAAFPSAAIAYWQQTCPHCSEWQNGNLQCVMFAKAAYALGGDPVPVSGNAVDYWSLYRNRPGWLEIPSAAAPPALRGLPAPGDLMVWANTQNPYGHIAVVVQVVPPTATQGGSVTFAEANSPAAIASESIAPDLSVRTAPTFPALGYIRHVSG